jgi:hypothetical protein
LGESADYEPGRKPVSTTEGVLVVFLVLTNEINETNCVIPTQFVGGLCLDHRNLIANQQSKG